MLSIHHTVHVDNILEGEQSYELVKKNPDQFKFFYISRTLPNRKKLRILNPS